jgi:hypothetical protein
MFLDVDFSLLKISVAAAATTAMMGHTHRERGLKPVTA